MTLQARLYANFDKHPDRRALAFYTTEGMSWLNYGQLAERSNAAAGALASRNVRPGDVCVIVRQSDEACAMAVLGALMAGALPLLVAPPVLQGASSHLSEVLRFVIQRTKARAAICAESMEPMRTALEADARECQFVWSAAELSDASDRGTRHLPNDSDVLGLQLTSGTTARPRVCVWRQRNVLAALDGMASAMDLCDDDVGCNWTPLYHDMGLVNNFFLCLSRGLPLVMLSPTTFIRSPELWLRALSECRATQTWSPNFGFAVAAQRINEDELKNVRLDHVRGFWNAAERIHLPTMLEFHRRFAKYGVELQSLKTNFGCAENVGGATFSDPHGNFVVEHVDQTIFENEERAEPVDPTSPTARSVSIVGVGRASPGMEIRILNDEHEELPDGHIGQVALHTPSRMEGYLGDDEETRQAVAGDLLLTGDLGYLRGEELFWTGRVRERINTCGKKFDPSDFEAALAGIDGLRPGCFAVFGIDDATAGTQLPVLIAEVRTPGARAAGDIVRDIQRKIRGTLGIELHDVLLVDSGTLAKTSSGKRRHRHFRQQYLQRELESLRIM